jgi:hypothetical protein
MKALGSLLMVVGGIFLFWAMFIFDTSVSVSGRFGSGMYDTRVNNLGLMSDKKDYITISGIMLVVGLILFLFDKSKEDQATESKEDQPTQSEEMKNTDNQDFKIWKKSRDLNNDEYKIYLVKKYSIEKNNALEKILAHGKLFNTIDEALVAMDEKDALDQSSSLNSTLGISDLPEHIENEISHLSERLKKYNYTITKYDKNKNVWEVSGSSGKFDQNLSQLKSLLKNFEK